MGEGLEKVELSYIIGEGESIKWYNYFGKMYSSFFEHTITLKPNNSILKYLPNVREYICPQKTWTKMLSSISSTSIHHWGNRQTTESHLAIKRNILLIHTAKE